MNHSTYRELLDVGNYLTLNKTLIKFLGLMCTAYLSALIDREKYCIENNQTIDDGWFVAKQECIEKRIGISSYQQSSCLSDLKEKGLVLVEKKGVPATNYYLINYDEIINLLKNVTTPNDKCPKNLGTSAQKIRGQVPKKLGHYNINNKDINNEDKNISSQSEPSLDKTEDIVSNKFNLHSSEREKRVQGKRSLNSDEELRVLEVYKKFLFSNCNSKTVNLVEGIPVAIDIFKQYFPKDEAVDYLCLAIKQFRKSEWFKNLIAKDNQTQEKNHVFIISPKIFFSRKFIENTLLTTVSNIQTDGEIHHRSYSEDELRKVKESNKRGLEQFMEKD